MPPVAVVGGGWAGIAAAVELAARGIPVVLLESAPALGGRARDVATPLGTLDNGQHLLIGAYRAVLGLLARLGIDESAALARRPLGLHMGDLAGGAVRLQVPQLPAPLHLAKALTTARGLGLGERLAAVRFTAWLQRHDFAIPESPLGALLAARGQPARLVRALWEPLCLATLNTPLARASSRLFARVLQESFTGARQNCDLLLPRQPLGTLLPEPARRHLERHGASVRTSARVTALECRQERLVALRLQDGDRLEVAGAVLAPPAPVAAALLAAHPASAALAGRLRQLAYQPICTVYLRYPRPVALDGVLRGVLGGTTQWLVDRQDCGQPELVAGVVSADGEHMALGREALAARVAGEAARLFPGWAAPLESLVIREKRATFASVAGVDALRPPARTPLHGLWLAGDWTATGLPATLEGAVRSGLESARAAAEFLADGHLNGP